MDEIQLRMKVLDVEYMAGAIERDLTRWPEGNEPADLTRILSWLRYRTAKWHATHPDTPAA